MTDRIHVLTVHLDDDYRDDDAQVLIDAISQLRGVAEVEPHAVSLADQMARARLRNELQGECFEAIARVFGK